MKILIALLSLWICATALASDNGQVEAITAISLPVDSVTIYPDGLISVKRIGSLETTEGIHKFVMDVPGSADRDSILLSVTNATIERVVYEQSPIYTLNVTSPASQKFSLSYLMYNAGYWEPLYDLHLKDNSILVSSQARITNQAEEDLKNVKLKLVAGLPVDAEPVLIRRAAKQIQLDYADMAFEAAAPAEPPATGELETLYIFELEGRNDLERDKDIGLPLFEQEAPLERIYIWEANIKESGPAVEEIRANNTMANPWPSGKALLYRNGEYVSTLTMPYTAAGTNASIVIGPSADLKVSRKLKDYNITEKIREINSLTKNNTVKETTEIWSYHLKVESNVDKNASIEVTDVKPKEAKITAVSPEPSEITATAMKWKLTLKPREKKSIDYVYQIVTTEPLSGPK